MSRLTKILFTDKMICYGTKPDGRRIRITQAEALAFDAKRGDQDFIKVELRFRSLEEWRHDLWQSLMHWMNPRKHKAL